MFSWDVENENSILNNLRVTLPVEGYRVYILCISPLSDVIAVDFAKAQTDYCAACNKFTRTIWRSSDLFLCG